MKSGVPKLPEMKLTLTLFLILLACRALEGARYEDPNHRLSLEYDDSLWEPVEVSDSRTLVTLQRKIADDKYHARFSVVVDDLKKFDKKGQNLRQAYLSHAVDFLKKQRFQNVTVTDRGQGFSIIANQRDFGLTFRQVIMFQKNQAFLVTAAARTAKFKEYEKELQPLFDSLSF